MYYGLKLAKMQIEPTKQQPKLFGLGLVTSLPGAQSKSQNQGRYWRAGPGGLLLWACEESKSLHECSMHLNAG